MSALVPDPNYMGFRLVSQNELANRPSFGRTTPQPGPSVTSLLPARLTPGAAGSASAASRVVSSVQVGGPPRVDVQSYITAPRRPPPIRT